MIRHRSRGFRRDPRPRSIFVGNPRGRRAGIGSGPASPSIRDCDRSPLRLRRVRDGVRPRPPPGEVGPSCAARARLPRLTSGSASSPVGGSGVGARPARAGDRAAPADRAPRSRPALRLDRRRRATGSTPATLAGRRRASRCIGRTSTGSTATSPCADLAVVQGGLTTTMELAACQACRSSTSPCAHHFEQIFHVRARLRAVQRRPASRLRPTPISRPRRRDHSARRSGAPPTARAVETDGAADGRRDHRRNWCSHRSTPRPFLRRRLTARTTSGRLSVDRPNELLDRRPRRSSAVNTIANAIERLETAVEPAEPTSASAPADRSRRSTTGCAARPRKGRGSRRRPPAALGGTGAAPTPGVLLRAALGSCMAMSYRLRAAKHGVELTSVRVTVEADSELAGMLLLRRVGASRLHRDPLPRRGREPRTAGRGPADPRRGRSAQPAARRVQPRQRDAAHDLDPTRARA